MSFDDEDESFRRYAEAFPGATTLLIDTYDTVAAARRIVAKELECKAVRLDSGDLRQLSLDVRKVFDAGGRSEIKIAASGDLNEEKIEAMEEAGCAIDLYGVGTEMVVSKDCPSLGGVYKVVATCGSNGTARHPIKLSSSKRSWPGIKQVFRREDGGRFAGDTIALADEPAPAGAPLLVKVMEGGRRTAPSPTLAEVRARCLAELKKLPDDVARIREPAPYPVERSEAAVALADKALHEALAELEREELVSEQVAFLDVDTQVDFVEPSGKLYAQGAEAIKENLAALVALARARSIPLVASVDAHGPDDAEFAQFPPLPEGHAGPGEAAGDPLGGDTVRPVDDGRGRARSDSGASGPGEAAVRPVQQPDGRAGPEGDRRRDVRRVRGRDGGLRSLRRPGAARARVRRPTGHGRDLADHRRGGDAALAEMQAKGATLTTTAEVLAAYGAAA